MAPLTASILAKNKRGIDNHLTLKVIVLKRLTHLLYKVNFHFLAQYLRSSSSQREFLEFIG